MRLTHGGNCGIRAHVGTRSRRGAAAGSKMKQIWAILCVIGFAAFWTFGFLALSEIFGERDFSVLHLLFAALGLALGLVGRAEVLKVTPRMHGKRAEARVHLEEELLEQRG